MVRGLNMRNEDKLDLIFEKVQKLSNKVDFLEERMNKQDISAKKTKAVFHSNTIQPSEMEEGRFAYVGKYKSKDGTMSATFGADNNSIFGVFDCNSFEMARVIDAFSSEDRINIVKELIQRSMSARQLMEKLQFPTTGKLYHHLSFLEKIGVVRKDSDQYHVSARYISCVVLIFMGVEKIVRNSQND